MNPTEIAEFLVKFGAVGVAVIEGGVIVYLFRKLMESWLQRIRESNASGEQVGQLIEVLRVIAPLLQKTAANTAVQRMMADKKQTQSDVNA